MAIKPKEKCVVIMGVTMNRRKYKFLIITVLILLAACSNGKSGNNDLVYLEDLDRAKAKEAIINGALESNVLSNAEMNYSGSDIKIISLCEALEINYKSEGFKKYGYFQVIWETNDGLYDGYFLLNGEYGVENYANFQSIEDRCITDL
ncbi:hypothetical protein [Paucisalibacillus globulus]|uniref:hypothetical protein n=1 Tax=Paucisalibacillus globulus TaxID=351095 RepID=UPI00040BD15E|nr:hypothetical protein [Paucisalibacillus globulus]